MEAFGESLIDLSSLVNLASLEVGVMLYLPSKIE